MKKGAKIIIIIGVVFILAGGLFCGAAYALGENYVDGKTTDISEDFTSGDVNKLNINNTIASVKIFKGDDNAAGSISIQAENVIESELKCDLSNNILTISYNPTTVKFGFITLPSGLFNWNKSSPVINIYIPADKLFDEVYFTGNIGNINIDDISAKDFTIDSGVGNFSADNMTVSGNLNIGNRVGGSDINAVINGQTKIDGGVGSINVSGQANGDITINGGVGSINMDLSGSVTAYAYNVKGGLGSIKLNGNKINDSWRSAGDYNIKIDGGVGSININIK
ncbi:MAG: DUF4097 domain-containing protein [Oscillospiraceae bacterium]|nr:DUF4097 domain-containing protein [Oscillospiraceae bacterium]